MDGIFLEDNWLLTDVLFADGESELPVVFRDGEPLTPDWMSGSYELKTGKNELGLMIMRHDGDRYRYVDFQYITVFSKVAVSIEPPRIIVCELTEDSGDEIELTFVAAASPAGTYTFVWDFDDGTEHRDEQSRTRDDSRVSHTFRGLADGDEYFPGVKIYDQEGTLLGEDSVTVKVVTRSPLIGLWAGELPFSAGPVLVSIEPGTDGYDYNWRYLDYAGDDMSDFVFAGGRELGGGIVTFEGVLGFSIWQIGKDRIYVTAPPVTLRKIK